VSNPGPLASPQGQSDIPWFWRSPPWVVAAAAVVCDLAVQDMAPRLFMD